jgi:hypothetical protein
MAGSIPALPDFHAIITQLGEYLFCNQDVASSNLANGFSNVGNVSLEVAII